MIISYLEEEPHVSVWDKYFEAYRNGRQVADLYLALNQYRQVRDIRTLYRLRKVWLQTEYSLNQQIIVCDSTQRHEVFTD